MWLRKGAKTFAEPIDEDFNSLAQHHFQNANSKVQGQLAEILDLIPQRFQDGDAFKTGWISKTVSVCLGFAHVIKPSAPLHQFLNAMSSQRSNTSTRIRKTAGHSIFQCKAIELVNQEKRIELFHAMIGWVDEGNGKGHYDSLNVEILHKDYQGHFDMNTIFLNPILLRVRINNDHEKILYNCFLRSLRPLYVDLLPSTGSFWAVRDFLKEKPWSLSLD